MRLHLEMTTHRRHHLAQEKQLLASLSPNLLADLKTELRLSVIKRHNFFSEVHELLPRCLARVCHDAVSTAEVVTGDSVFHTRDLARRMYFVAKGDLCYQLVLSPQRLLRNLSGDLSASSDESDDTRFTTLKRGTWISEAALWMPWKHLGALIASSDSQVLSIDSEGLQGCVLDSPNLHAMCVAYAKIFRTAMVRAKGTDILDAGFVRMLAKTPRLRFLFNS